MLTAAAWLSLLTLSAAWQGEGNIDLRGENRVGHFATEGGPPQGTDWGVELTPAARLRAHDPTHELELYYRPQFLLDFSVPQGQVLALHAAGAGLTKAGRRGETYRFAIAGLTGTLDYGRAMRVLGAEGILPAFPAGELVRYSNVDAYGGAILNPTRRLAIHTELQAGYTGPGVGFPSDLVLQQLRSLALVRTAFRLTRRDTFSTELGAAIFDFQSGPLYTSLTPALSYARRVTRDTNFTMRGGVQVTHTRPAPGDPVTLAGVTLQPVGDTALTCDLSRAQAWTVTSVLSAAVAPFYDPFLADLVPRAVLEARAELRTSAQLLTRLRAQWYQPLPSIIPSLGSGAEVRERSLLTTSLLASRPIVGRLSAEAGVVAMARWNRMEGAAESIRHPELLGYLALTATLGKWE